MIFASTLSLIESILIYMGNVDYSIRRVALYNVSLIKECQDHQKQFFTSGLRIYFMGKVVFCLMLFYQSWLLVTALLDGSSCSMLLMAVIVNLTVFAQREEKETHETVTAL